MVRKGGGAQKSRKKKHDSRETKELAIAEKTRVLVKRLSDKERREQTGETNLIDYPGGGIYRIDWKTNA